MHAPKLSAPALQAHVVPTEVLSSMESVEHYSAHWLSAGAGSGKTQITRMWLEQVKRPYAWVQLDPRDNDPLCILETLRMAMQPLVNAPSILPSFMPEGGLSLQRHCEYLWHQTVATLEEPSVLVLDDAHLIRDWESHPVLHSLLLDLDPRLHIVVLSRGDLPTSYARHVVNRRICWVEPHRFVWKAPHVQAWLLKRWNLKKPAPSLVEQLLLISQGKAAVLALLDVPALIASPEPMTKAAASQLELAWLMETSILEKLSSWELEILHWLACLGSFPQEWLRSLGFPEAIEHCVKEWMQSTSVVVKLERSEDELRFHPLFAELLRKGELNVHPELAELRARVIDACLFRGRVLDAIELCKETGLWERYWVLVQDAGLKWIEQGQVGQLGHALDSLPATMHQQFAGPTLSLFMSALELHERPAQAYTLAIEALKGSSRTPELRAVWAMSMSMAASAVMAVGLSMDHFSPIGDELEKAIEAPWFTELVAPLRLSALRAGMLAAMRGKGGPPMEILHKQTVRALTECESVDLQAAAVSAMMRVMVLHGLSEYVESAEAHLRSLEDLVESPAGQLSLVYAKSTLNLALGKKAASLQASNELLAKCDDGASSIWHLEVRAAAAFCAACTHNFPQLRLHCDALSKQTQELQGAGPGPRLHSHFYIASTAAHEQRWADAKRHFNLALDASRELQYPLMQVAALSSLAIVQLELEEENAAKANLEEIQAVLSSCHIPLCERIFTSTNAFIALRTSTTQAAIQAVRAAVQQLVSSNFYLLILEFLPQHAEFLAFALEHDIEPDLVEKLIRRSPLYPKTRPHPRWPYLFEVQVLGRFELKINGKDARERFLSSGRRFELLTILLWVGGQGLSYDDCLAWVWEHMKGRERGLRTMKAAIKRLRSDLGREDAILEEDERISLNPELWDYDGWRMQARLAQPGHEPEPKDLTLLRRGFFGPTPIPAAMRHLVPSQGAVDLGPKPLLGYLGIDEPTTLDPDKTR